MVTRWRALDQRRTLGANRGASLAILAASSLLPLWGVLRRDWDVGAIVILYWSQKLILGALTLGKMIAVNPLAGVFSGRFFALHHGGFCAVHGLFVLALVTDAEPRMPGADAWPSFLVFLQLLVSVVRQVIAVAPVEWQIGFLALLGSHAVSLALNYVGRGEYASQTLRSLMSAPNKRIVVLHIAIIAGGFGTRAPGSPLPLLVLLVLLKLGLDIGLHLREHRAPAAAAVARAG